MIWAIAAAAAAVACSAQSPSQSPSQSKTESKVETATAETSTSSLTATAATATATSPPPSASASPIPAASLQLITGVVPDWSSTTATLRLWTRADSRSPWRAAGDAWPATIGTSGAAWGRGLHGDAPPAGRAGSMKLEGDGKAPAGAFAVRHAYGYAAAAPPGTRLPYAELAADTECVDDPASSHYTQILSRGSDADWTSAEHMRRPDELYAWVIDIAHNPRATPHGGSCIFFHVWHDARSPTVGCTAMAEPRLAALLAELAPSAVYVLLPRAEYVALAPAWGLPPP